MTARRLANLVRPTLDTPFHIDFDWWQEHDRDWRVHLRNLLCPEHHEQFASLEHDETIDWVDPETAEVHAVDGLQHVLMTHCALQPGFLHEGVPLVDAVFRLFLMNGNTPMTPTEIAQRLNRPPMTVLRTLSGPRVYRGIRPVVRS